MKRHSYKIKEKLDAFKKLQENDNNISLTARQLNISNKMLRDWKVKKSHLLILKIKIRLKRLVLV